MTRSGVIHARGTAQLLQQETPGFISTEYVAAKHAERVTVSCIDPICYNEKYRI